MRRSARALGSPPCSRTPNQRVLTVTLGSVCQPPVPNEETKAGSWEGLKDLPKVIQLINDSAGRETQACLASKPVFSLFKIILFPRSKNSNHVQCKILGKH